MSEQFRVGDRVRLKKSWSVGARHLVGKEGEVVGVMPGTLYDGYWVDFGGEHGVQPFIDFELALVLPTPTEERSG